MSDRIHVTIALDLFVEDEGEMRRAAFERLRGAWSSDEDFPYEAEADVPLDAMVHSLLADALDADMPGCRRSQLEVEVKAPSKSDSDTSAGDDSETTNEDDSAGEDGSSGEDVGGGDAGAEQESTAGEAEDSGGAAASEDEQSAEKSASDESSSTEGHKEEQS